MSLPRSPEGRVGCALLNTMIEPELTLWTWWEEVIGISVTFFWFTESSEKVTKIPIITKLIGTIIWSYFVMRGVITPIFYRNPEVQSPWIVRETNRLWVSPSFGTWLVCPALVYLTFLILWTPSLLTLSTSFRNSLVPVPWSTLLSFYLSSCFFCFFPVIRKDFELMWLWSHPRILFLE